MLQRMQLPTFPSILLFSLHFFYHLYFAIVLFYSLFFPFYTLFCIIYVLVAGPEDVVEHMVMPYGGARVADAA